MSTSKSIHVIEEVFPTLRVELNDLNEWRMLKNYYEKYYFPVSFQAKRTVNGGVTCQYVQVQSYEQVILLKILTEYMEKKA